MIEFGGSLYSLFKVLQKLFLYNHLHKAILICLMSNPNRLWFKIHGITEEEECLLHEDLNELFESLNNLSEDDDSYSVGYYPEFGGF